MKILTFLFLCFASVALADDFKAIDGKEYKNVSRSHLFHFARSVEESGME